MLLALSALAVAAVPTAFVAQGDDRLELDVRQFASSEDGSIVVACSEEKVVPLVGEMAEVTLDPGGIVAVDVSSAGWLALAHQGGVTIHDENGKELLRLGGYTGLLSDLALSPDGKVFAVASSESVALHRTADGKLLWSRKGAAWSVTFHPDGTKVIAGIASGNLVLNTTNGRVAGGFDTKPAVWFKWTADALYTREEGGSLETWDPGTLKATEWQPALGLYDTIAVHPDGTWLLADGCVAPAGATQPTSLCVGEGTVAATFSGEGELFVAQDGVVRAWGPLDASSVTDLGLTPGGPRVVGISAADGGDWVIATEDGLLQRLAADGTSRFQARVPGCVGACRPLAMGGAGPRTWAIGPGGHAVEWDAQGNELVRPKKTKAIAGGRLEGGDWVILQRDGKVRVGSKPGKGSKSAAVPGAHTLVAGTQGYVVVGDTVQPFKADGTPRTQPRLGPGGLAKAVTVDKLGLAFAVVDEEGSLHRFSADGRPVFRKPLKLPAGVDVSWSSDGAWLAVGGAPLRIFDAANGDAAKELVLSPPGVATFLAASDFGFLGVVQGTPEHEEVRLLRLPSKAPPEEQ